MRVALASLRNGLGPVLRIERHWIAWNKPFLQQFDGHQFLTAVRVDIEQDSTLVMNQLEDGLSLYTAQFMEKFRFKDTPAFNEWVILTSERMLRHAILGRQQLAELAKGHWNRDQEEQNLRALIELDPLNGRWRRSMMRLLTSRGSSKRARAEFRAFRTALMEGLQVEPGRETLALYQRISTQRSTGHVSEMPENLPVFSTPFQGRQAILERTVRLLTDPQARTVTLLGPGGVGKTRLAVECAGRLRSHFRDGVAFIAVPTETQDSSLLPLLAQFLGIKSQAANPELSTIVKRLRDRKLLIVLDPFEHRVAGAAEIGELAAALPHLTFLVTSRERLNTPLEWIVEIGGLDCEESDSSAQKIFLLGHDRLIRELNSVPTIVPTSVRSADLLVDFRLHWNLRQVGHEV